MKPLIVLSSLLALATAKQAPLQNQKPLSEHPPLHGHLPVMADTKTSSSNNDVGPAVIPVALVDVLGSQRTISTFSSFTRLDSDTERLLGDLQANTTVLAPLNSVIDALPRKPWEDPRDYERLGPKAYSGGDGQERARKNMLRFVEAHLVAGSPWAQGEKADTILGKQVWWVERDGKKVLMPDDVEVDRVASRVTNGEVWFIKGVLNYE